MHKYITMIVLAMVMSLTLSVAMAVPSLYNTEAVSASVKVTDNRSEVALGVDIPQASINPASHSAIQGTSALASSFNRKQLHDARVVASMTSCSNSI